ncbi:asparagine synthase (glutamine-hydrolyzing) [Paenibacillus sp. EKM208P]|nr:asparagine synthase (glutamine-hydrolyzing) [Paenibacillus sp. EKM208P]
MCGIAGVVRLDGTSLSQNVDTILQNMAEEISYRGPDDEQFFIKGPLGFAFRRLSIVDINGGKQPLTNEDGTIVLIANGEIYNSTELRAKLSSRHQYKTNSDCEIILHLYEEKGIDLLQDLIGMYAFALWDSRKQKMFIARDRFGIKPLFFTANRERLVFASEIKSLMKYPDCPRSLDWNKALTDPWLSGYTATDLSDPSSFFEGIEHLPAGCAVEVDVKKGSWKQIRYWDLLANNNQSFAELSDQEIINYYANLLEDSVQKCLQSDVEIGLFLSGGIDSASIAAITSERQNIHTFSVLSQSTLTNEDAKYAHITAKYLGLPNHQVLFHWDENDFEPNHWRKLLWLCESPLCGPEQLYKFHLHRYARSVCPDLKVILTGQGSDEFNGGYSSVLAPAWENNWEGFTKNLNRLEMGRYMSNLPSKLFVWEEHFEQSPLSEKFILSKSSEVRRESSWEAYILTKFRDIQMYNCWLEDRIAAGNSIENRVPFLDHRIVEFALSIPSARRKGLFWDKKLLRSGIQNRLPSELYKRSKVPFFYGEDARFTLRMMLDLLLKQKSVLLEEAVASSKFSDFIDTDAFFSIAQQLSQDPEVTNMEYFLRIVNMGLLQHMVEQTNVKYEDSDNFIILSNHPIENWEKNEEEIHLKLSKRREAIKLEDIPLFAPEVFLMQRDDIQKDNHAYLVVDNHLTYALSEDEAGQWLRVLRKINGEQSLKEILSDLDITESEIRKFLEEAIDFGVITMKPIAN